MLFTFGNAAPYKIIMQSFQSGERKELFAGDNARYIPTGHIVYTLGNNLFAVPFDLKTLKVTGGQVPMVEGIWRVGTPYASQYAVSDSGTLVYIQGSTSEVAPNQRAFVWVDRKGKETPIGAPPNDYRTPKISPDGTKVALNVIAGDKSDIWIWDFARETMTRLTFDGLGLYPLWTPDGNRIAFAKGGLLSDLSTSLYWKAANGTGEEEKLGSMPKRVLLPWSWSSDGNTLALFELDPDGGGNYDIGTLSMKGSHELKPLLNQKYIETQPKISPDGKWMAYTSSESGQPEIYVRSFPDVDKGKWQVSASGGNTPLWSPDGRELFYLNGDAAMRVRVESTPTFKAGKPETLFRGTYVRLSTDDGQPWDISPDGKRFLMIKPPELPGTTPTSPSPRKINVVMNWLEELKQRVPAD